MQCNQKKYSLLHVHFAVADAIFTSLFSLFLYKHVYIASRPESFSNYENTICLLFQAHVVNWLSGRKSHGQ